MNAFLFRFRGELLTLWGIGALALGWPSHGYAPSVAFLIAGLALRVWARRHIGRHSRGRSLECPERSVAGPYRYLQHPLYLANLLVAASLSFSLAGLHHQAFVLLLGPLLLYTLLAKAETAFVSQSGSPDRTTPHDRSTGGWRSEWASFVPPVCAWMMLQFLATP